MKARETETVQPGPLRTVDAVGAFGRGDLLAGRFEIRGTLGRGGSSCVYRAWDRALEQEVAIKALRADRPGARATRRLRREVEIAREVVHPNLVRIFDIGTQGDVVFVSMELVEGGSLRELIARGPLPIDRIEEIAEQTLEGVAALHEARVLHRDLKPGNILLDGDGRVRVADFGLARRLDGRDPETRSLAGTLEYLSPEQALGEPLGPPSDVYSLGLVLWEMAVGELPGRRSTDVGTILSRFERPLPDPRSRRPELPGWTARAILHFTERSPRRRPENAVSALRIFRARRSPRRRRSLPLLAGLSGVVLLALLSVAAWFHDDDEPFSHLRIDSLAVQAIAESGEVLWSLEAPDEETPIPERSVAVARLSAEGPPRVVGFPEAHQRRGPARHRLQILEARTGRTIDEILLPSGARHFTREGISDRFRPRVAAEDLDGDGLDEVIVTYLHRVYWPSYSVVWNPGTDRRSVVLVAGGHHRFVGAVDLDGDSHRELLYLGIANHLGWGTGLAAVRVPDGTFDDTRSPAFTPDRPQAAAASPNALTWYALLSLRHCIRIECFSFDPERSLLRVNRLRGEATTLTFEGFDSSLSADDPGERARLRQRTYDRLREATRLEIGERWPPALEAAGDAIAAARSARLDVLAEWAMLVRGRILASSGRLPEAETRFLELVESSDFGREAAYQAGRAFHLEGKIERSIDWYRRGLGADGDGLRGRLDYEYLLGIVLAGSEGLAWDRVREDIEFFAAAYEFSRFHAEVLGAVVDWRSGETPDSARLEELRTAGSWDHAPDLYRIWLLELRKAADLGKDLLPEIDGEHRRVSASLLPLLDSLEAALLLERDRGDEALTRARDAVAAMAGSLRDDPVARAHYDLALERLIAAARAAGDSETESEARHARSSWRDVHESQDRSRSPTA